MSCSRSSTGYVDIQACVTVTLLHCSTASRALLEYICWYLAMKSCLSKADVTHTVSGWLGRYSEAVQDQVCPVSCAARKCGVE